MSQGQIERLNQTIGRGFTKMLWNEEDQQQNYGWIDHLPNFIFSYNTTRHSAHGMTPREVLFKITSALPRTDSSPFDIEEDILDVEQQEAEKATLSERVKEQLTKASQIYEKASARLQKTREYMLRSASVHRRQLLFEPGQKVAMAPDTDMNPTTRKRKIQANFMDTGVVVSMCNNNQTVVVNVNGELTRWATKRVRLLKNTTQSEEPVIEPSNESSIVESNTNTIA